MITYKINYHCHGYLTEYYEIHMMYDDVTIGCIYYLKDSLKGSKPVINFDKWRKYSEYQVPTIDPTKVALDVIFEHYFLE